MQKTLESAFALRNHLSLSIYECSVCGFAENLDFAISNVDYSELPVTESAGFSPGYRTLQDSLAKRLNSALADKVNTVLEIGAADGYFLQQVTATHKYAYEPSLEGKNIPSDIHCVPEYFVPKDNTLAADLIVMRQVLEHIPNPYSYITDLIIHSPRIKQGNSLYLYIEVPSYEATKDSSRFCDFYYEHCNYFTRDSLSILARKAGGKVLESSCVYNGEIICMLVRFSGKPASSYSEMVQKLRHKVEELLKEGQTISVWGLSGNGITLLNTIKANSDMIKYVIDSDSRKQGSFVPVTGQQVISPNDAAYKDINTIFVASQFHQDEIVSMCRSVLPCANIYNLSGELLC